MQKSRSICLTILAFAGIAFLTAPVSVDAQNRRLRERAEKLVLDGNRDFNQKKFEDAIKKYAEAIVLVPRSSSAHFWKGVAHNNLGQTEMALKELDLALTSGYEKPIDVYSIRWRIHYRNNDFASAMSDVNNGLALDPNNAEFLIAKGDMFFVEKKYPEALDVYEKALLRAPNNAELNLNISKIHFQLGNHDKQLSAAQEAINKGTRSPGEGFLLVALAQQNKRNYNEAIEAYQRALALIPDRYEIYQSLSDLFRIQNRFQDAIDVSRKALSVFTSNERVLGLIYTDLSWYYSLAERHEDAVEAGKAGIRYLPESHMAYTNLCRAYNDLRRPEMAIRECNNALRYRPNDGETNFYLGYSHSLLNRQDEAARYYKRAVAGLEQFTQDNKTYSDGFYLLGNAYFADGQTEKAVAAYRQALALSPRFARGRYNLGYSLVQLKNRSAALEQYNILLGIDAKLAEKLKTEIDKLSGS